MPRALDNSYLIYGAGQMAHAILYDLLQSASTSRVTLIDTDPDRLAKITELALPLIADGRRDACVRTLRHSICLGDGAFLREEIGKHDVGIGACSYEHYEQLTRLHIEEGRDFLDLGGNDDVVAAQTAMHDRAVANNVRIFPGCGIAPGAENVLARLAIDEVGGSPELVTIRCGGLPQWDVPPFGYVRKWSVRGLINEYKEPATVLRQGELMKVASLHGVESVDIPTIGTLEAAYTSGGLSTLAATYHGLISNIDYKTLRYPGHWAAMRAFRDAGMFSDEPVLCGLSPRAMLESQLMKTLPTDAPDMLVLAVSARASDGRTSTYQLIDYADPMTGLSAMQRTTGFSAAIVAQMLRHNHILEAGGVLTHESSIPCRTFLRKWEQRGIVPMHFPHNDGVVAIT